MIEVCRIGPATLTTVDDRLDTFCDGVRLVTDRPAAHPSMEERFSTSSRIGDGET